VRCSQTFGEYGVASSVYLNILFVIPVPLMTQRVRKNALAFPLVPRFGFCSQRLCEIFPFS